MGGGASKAKDPGMLPTPPPGIELLGTQYASPMLLWSGVLPVLPALKYW